MLYFPSCNFNAMRPAAAKRLHAMLAERMPAAGCCRLDRNEYPESETGIYLCQACREVLEPKLRFESLWVYLDGAKDWVLPDWSGLTVSVQDCWRDRAHPEIHEAVRSLLRKMGVRVEEIEESREKSVFCGDLHFEPKLPENLALLERAKDTPLWQMPQETVEQLMREQTAKFSTPYILTYCNRCTKGIEAGGGKAVHLAELVTGVWEEAHSTGPAL